MNVQVHAHTFHAHAHTPHTYMCTHAHTHTPLSLCEHLLTHTFQSSEGSFMNTSIVLSSSRGEVLRARMEWTMQLRSCPDSERGRSRLMIWGVRRNGISSGSGRNWEWGPQGRTSKCKSAISSHNGTNCRHTVCLVRYTDKAALHHE